jgi:hypothetical protein
MAMLGAKVALIIMLIGAIDAKHTAQRIPITSLIWVNLGAIVALTTALYGVKTVTNIIETDAKVDAKMIWLIMSV